MSEKKLPNRAEIPEADRWKLEHIYATPEDWEREAEEVKGLLPCVAAFQGRLGESAAVLADALELRDRISRKAEKLFVYARMRRDEDNGDTLAQARADRAENLLTQVQSVLSYFTPEILSIPEEVIKVYLQAEPRLKVYTRHIHEILEERPHILSGAEERILAELGEVLGAVDTAFTMLTNVDIEFEPVITSDGERIELTKGRYSQFMEGEDREVRRQAFSHLHQGYKKLANTLAATLAGAVKRDVVFARLRRYGSALEAALSPDKVPVQVYEELITTVRRFHPQLYRYFALKKKALNLDELHFYDLYAPMISGIKMEFSYEEAKARVLRGLAPLGEEYIRKLKEGLEGGWVDVYENRNKTGGAYAWGCYDSHPYVLLNYQPSLSSVLTLAHEMGHALHSAYSNAHQPYIYAQYPIILAEVASTVNEVLMMEDLLLETTDPKVRLYLLNRFLEEFRGTVFRQTMFAEFERVIHHSVEMGEALTPEYLSQQYLELNRAYHGDGVVLDPGLEVEWARIPHFYTGFYVYKYATGFSAAVALARRILKEGEPAVWRYLEFLRSGNSDDPLVLLKRAGVDLTTPEPVTEALQYFTELLDQLEAEL